MSGGNRNFTTGGLRGKGLGAWITDPVKILMCVAVFTSAGAHVDDVYFSSLQSIQVFTNNTTAVVFRDPSHTGALVCNPNPRDHRIYWIDMQSENIASNNIPMIKKGIPNNVSSIEVVISRDLHDPKGLAVDWAANNVYFSQRRDVGGIQGRIEVISSDGRKRRVLFDTLDTVGSLTINVLTGHLYFVEDNAIDRCNLDGSNRQSILEIEDSVEINGLAIDVANNIIYWTQTTWTLTSVLRSYDMDLFDESVVTVMFDGHEHVRDVILESSMHLFEVSVFNNSIYWTVTRDINTLTSQIISPGSLYHSLMDVLPVVQPRLLARGDDIDPHGVCTFYNVTAMSSPCYDASNMCEEDAFCFAVPDPVNGGTRGSCACPTGLSLNADNRSCSDVPQNFLLYPHHLTGPFGEETARTELRIIPLDTGNNFVDIQLPIDLHFTEVLFVTYDPIQHKVYWTEEEPPAIMRANLDGTAAEVFINTSISKPESMAVDPYSGNFYWADSGLDIISVARIDNPQIRRALVRDVMHPQGLAIDAARGFMYWSDLDTNLPAVERAHMDGTNRQILSKGSIQSPTNVAVDPLTGNVFWIEYDDNSVIVEYVNGQEMELFISRPDVSLALGLAVDGSYVYWTDRISSRRTIGRKIIGSTARAETLLSGVGGIGGLVVVNTSSPRVDTMCAPAQTGDVVLGRCNHLCLPSGNTSSPTCMCSQHHLLQEGSGSVCVDADPLVFVANSTYLTQLQVDVSTFITFQLTDRVYPIPGVGTVVKAMDVYVNGSTLFFIDGTNKRICSQSWEPSLYSCIVTCCLGAPEDLAVDWLGQNLYWTDSQRRVIEVSSLTGHGRSIIAKVPENLGGPSHIALDPHGGYIYWTSKTEAKIYRTRMDGTQQDSALVRRFSDSSSGVLGLSLNFSISGNLQIYWGVKDNQNDTHLLRSDIPPTEDPAADRTDDSPAAAARVDQHEVVVSDTRRLKFLNTLHVFKDDLYFNSELRGTPTITEADLFGNSGNIFSDDELQFSQFVFAHHSNQEGEHRCGVNHCTDNAGLCLVENGITGLCHCWPRSVTIPDTETDSNIGATCFVTDSFLVLATESEFSYLPVIMETEVKGRVQPLPFLPEGRIVDFAYDPINDSVLWVESGSNVLHGVNLDLESEWKILLSSNMSDNFDPFSLAYDWRGGHVVLTETDAFQLKLVTADGLEHGSLLDLIEESKFIVEKPGEVVLDPERSILYWTQRDGLSDLGRGLRIMHLSDLTSISTIALEGRLISHLNFEPVSQSLYWISRRGGSTLIERYNVTSGNFTTIAANAENVEGLTALSVVESTGVVPYVFWYNRTDQYLYNSTVDGRAERYVIWVTAERVVKILGHRTVADRTYACLAPDRPCSHICVPGNPTSTSYTCGCPTYSTLESDNRNCRASACGPNALACGDDFGECYPSVYFCDGIRHCKNDFDEQCTCNLTIENGCYSGFRGNGGPPCYSHQQRCDNSTQCVWGEDESMCCGEGMYGCYTTRSGRNQVSTWECLREDLYVCDGTLDCEDGSDETDSICITTPTTPTEITVLSKKDDENTLPIIISAVIISVIFVVLAVVIVAYVLSVFWRKRDEYRVGHGHHSIHYSTHSPQLRTDSTSDYSSEFSHGTNITQIGSAQSPCADKAAAALMSRPSNMPNPPPSPISTLMQPRHSLALSEDEVSTYSHGLSEYNAPPPPPCPSINYDNVSGNMSVSVSQTHFPATINGNLGGGGSSNNYHFQYPQGGHGGNTAGGRPPGRNANPLYASNPRQQQFANSAGLFQMRAMPGSGAPLTNQQTNHVHYNNPYYHSCNAHPDINELDNATHSDTDSTVSIATEEGNPDAFHFNSSMPHLPPPGRPPSPVTICSYPPGPNLHSPRSSTASFSSEA